MLLMLDNYDSFTYNLVQYLQELGEEVEVYRNDQIAVERDPARKRRGAGDFPGALLAGRGGISVAAIRHLAGEIPMLGVCLGHQSIGHAFGGRVDPRPQLMHGKTSPIHHDDSGDFPGPLEPLRRRPATTRWCRAASVPDCLRQTAWTEDGRIMGLEHRELPLWGVQFHPESILTVEGKTAAAEFSGVELSRNAGTRKTCFQDCPRPAYRRTALRRTE